MVSKPTKTETEVLSYEETAQLFIKMERIKKACSDIKGKEVELGTKPIKKILGVICETFQM